MEPNQRHDLHGGVPKGALIRAALGVAVAACVGLLSGEARAQGGGYLSELNQSYDDVRAGDGDDPGERTDMALLPLVAEMSASPSGLESWRDAALVRPELHSEVWSSASEWAGEASQQAVIAGLEEVSELDGVREMGWGQPYGIDGLEQIQLVSAGLYTEVPESLLGAARFLYFDGIHEVHRLAHIEATRRQLDGDPLGAIDVLRDWLLVVNQLLDREFAQEKHLAMRSMIDTLERMRDIGYEDFKGDRAMRGAEARRRLAEMLGSLKAIRQGGYLRVDRIAFPRANAMAAHQFAETLLEADGANEERFVEAVSMAMSSGNPLQMFSELPRARRLARGQLGRERTRSVIEGIVQDLRLRWNSEPFDDVLQTRSELDRYRALLDSRLVAAGPLRHIGSLVGLRGRLELERVGTRHALALLAYTYEQVIPPTASVVSPRWIDTIGNDPYNPRSAQDEASAFLQYLYLGRSRESGRTHAVAIVPEDAPRFERRFDARDFLLYSMGTDGSDDGAEEVQNTHEDVVDADYLIWPPEVSLLRQHLIDQRAAGG